MWCISIFNVDSQITHALFRLDLVIFLYHDIFSISSGLFDESDPAKLCFTLRVVGILSFISVSGSVRYLPYFTKTL